MKTMGWCFVCNTTRPSLPHPSEGTCAFCYNHMVNVKEVSDEEGKESYDYFCNQNPQHV